NSSKLFVVLRIATTGDDNVAGPQENVRHQDRLLQYPTRIVTEIKNVAFVPICRDFRRKILQGPPQVFARQVIELCDLDVAYVTADSARRNRVYANEVPDHS